MLLTGALLLFYATCVSAEVSQRRGGVSQRTGGRASAQKTLTFGNGALPTTRSPTGPPTEPPTFDWTQCKSEGGTKNCAKCKGGDLDDNGALPCDSASVDCPDNKLWKGSYFLWKTSLTRGGVAFSTPRCTSLRMPEALKGLTMSTYDFPGGIGNSSADKLDRNLVATKALVTHPDGASKDVGVVMFKRMVMHQCTGTKPDFCKKGDKVADVFKQGFCVQCKRKKYTPAKAWLSHLRKYGYPNTPDGRRWAACVLEQDQERSNSCSVFLHKDVQTQTDVQQRAFATQCFTEAFTPEGIMKADYQCSDDDMLYARASIAMF